MTNVENIQLQPINEKFCLDTGDKKGPVSISDKVCKFYTTLSGVVTQSGVQLAKDVEDKMRMFANRILDLIYEDKEKDNLRFTTEQI
jgi:hypothetical protein